MVKDYAARRFVHVDLVEEDKVANWNSTTITKSYLLSCTLMQNANGKQVEMLLNAESESDRERWLSAMRPPTVCYNI